MKVHIKNSVLGIACLSLFLGLAACNDFLEEKPKSEISTNQYFTKPDHARAAVNALYRRGVPEFNNAGDAYGGPNAMLGGYLSGLFDIDYKGQVILVQFSQSLTITSQNISSRLDEVWDACYSAIARANTAIKYIPETPELSETERNALLAQAKFFRALNYYHLVKFFGDVPLILEPYESLDELYQPRTATDEVYAGIERDLKEAISSGGLNNASFTQNDFRISRATAETVLASVYLQMSGYPLQSNHYADAAAMARSVINAGKHALLPNGATPEESTYNKIRTLDDSNEYIYSMEYVVGISDNGWRPTYSLPNTAAAWGIFKYAITSNVYAPTDVILNAYDPEKDLRIQEKQFFYKTYTYVKDGKETTVTFDRAADWFFYDEEALLETGKGGKDVPLYRYPEVLLIAAEAIAQTEGVTAEAVKYLADVRARAYTTTPRAEIESSLSGLSKEAFIREVWAERIRELVPDNKIWDDIQRTRMYPVTSATNKGQVDFINVIGATNPWGATFQEKHLLWPLSANEIQRNPSLIQNPGY
ncbi:MAG: RagB/SusD family nutrient uptake outer membrane protein [Tannerellaceae bacterium]|jgi:hypothetical protein|nr:RagB/SusD family nutrient uptake outer membrane protein [Tannerellaceae bacterium]